MEDFFETRPRLQLCRAPGIDEETSYTRNGGKVNHHNGLTEYRNSCTVAKRKTVIRAHILNS